FCGSLKPYMFVVSCQPHVPEVLSLHRRATIWCRNRDSVGDIMKVICSLALVAATLLSSSASAQYSDGVVKIGVLTDMSSIYSDIVGPGAVVAAKLAIQDSGVVGKGIKVEVIFADHQNKADIGSSFANSWFDVDKVDVIVEGGSSAVALAVSEA